ncbi:MAG: threonine-phosphate decarboxylase [Gomphosphaeria aponina SAG 52.96 = DSM 107014]|uniref:threonine-phosphate decarboxylase n=1 Tax=Gomphosphaeria aponina SAG 52.96 = DSM 107014 TaxID=1521640 RepID=A0A941JPJ4_9CHRO|nr:threonine-phosphate decarboxylase [Gomphosphaeria aponina SAG 52.96 = DSM 107014]
MKRPRHGGNLVWAAALAGCRASELVDFSASINPLGPPQSAIAAIQGSLAALTAYPDPNYSELCSTLSEWHELPPDWVLPGNGAAELLTWACRELSALDVTYLLTPAFGDYWRSLQTFGAKVHPVLLSEAISPSGLRINKIIPQIGKAKKRGILLNNPHNPTGNLFPQERLKPYLEEFNLVVVDEAFMDFLPPGEEQSLIPLVKEYTNLVILRSLTKFYSLPGLRLGYAIAHPERLRRWQKWRDPWPVNILAAAAAVAVIQDKTFQQQTWDWLPPTRQELFEGIKNIPGLQPLEGAANFLLVETEKPSSQLQKQLLIKHKILIRDCLSFPELGDRFFRLAVRTTQDNQLLLQALSKCLLDTI